MGRGRPRQFDEQEVLRKASVVFRERGYDGTSMQALSQAMNMGEQSIYNAFGSKEQLFERTLDQYCSESEAHLSSLAAPNASKAAIVAFFGAMVEKLGTEPACLVIQTCLSFDDGGGPVAKRIARHQRNIERHLLKALENAAAKGEVDSSGDPKQLARSLNMTVQGMGVMAQTGTSKKQLTELVDVALKVLG